MTGDRLPRFLCRCAVTGCALALISLPLLAAADVDLGSGTKTGALKLESIGPLTFGDDGVMFVADSTGAAIYAVDTGDQSTVGKAADISIDGIDKKIAAVLGTSADGIQIHDLATNPLSKQLYLSVTRGQGDGASPAIVKIDQMGKPSVFGLDNVRYSRASLRDAPGEDAKDRRGRPLRREALTDLEYFDGTLLVTGLSNEEFSSKLRKFEFPFRGVAGGTNIEIFHGAHGRWETNAPVRTMALYDIEEKMHVLAAYTCTPLVKFPVEELLDGQKVMGSTIAELGNRNRPLDMVIYRQGGRDFVLMANSSRGVMKIDLARISEVDEITERIPDKAGLAYETIAELQGIDQLAAYDGSRAVVLSRTDAGSSLRTISLP